MGPVLQINGELARDFRQMAARIRSDELSPAQVRGHLEQRILPHSQRLLDSAAAVQPAGPELAQAHGGLVEAWRERTESWTAMAAAWDAGELAAFEDAMTDAAFASRAEDRAWKQLLERTSACRPALLLYPPSAAR
jgi:hypothetical protein